MSVARDAVTEAPASFTTSTSFTHTPVGTPKGVLVFVAQNASSTDENGAISYGGVALTKQAFAHDTATELLGAYVYFLGSGIPTGAQTVSFSGWGSSTKIAWVYTLTAAADTAVEATGIAQENQADPAITLTTGAGVETYVAGMLASGIGSVGAITAGANGTARGSFDFGAQVAFTADRDVNGTGGSVVYDLSTSTTSDDVAMVAIAVKEAAGGGTTPINLSVGLTLSVAVTRTAINRNLSLALTLTPTVARTVQRQLSLALTLVPTVLRTVKRNVALALTFTPTVTVSRLLTRSINVALTLVPTVTRTVDRKLSLALTLAPTVTRTVSRLLSVGLTLAPTLTRTVSRKISVALTLVPTVTRTVKRLVSVPLNFTVTVTRNIPIAISVALSFAVTVTPTFVPAVVGSAVRLTWKVTKGWLHRTSHRRIDP